MKDSLEIQELKTEKKKLRDENNTLKLQLNTQKFSQNDVSYSPFILKTLGRESTESTSLMNGAKERHLIEKLINEKEDLQNQISNLKHDSRLQGDHAMCRKE
jgi:hypothetical protein